MCVYVTVVRWGADLSRVKLILVIHCKFQQKRIDWYASNPPTVFIHLQCTDVFKAITNFEHVFPF